MQRIYEPENLLEGQMLLDMLASEGVEAHLLEFSGESDLGNFDWLLRHGAQADARVDGEDSATFHLLARGGPASAALLRLLERGQHRARPFVRQPIVNPFPLTFFPFQKTDFSATASQFARQKSAGYFDLSLPVDVSIKGNRGAAAAPGDPRQVWYRALFINPCALVV